MRAINIACGCSKQCSWGQPPHRTHVIAVETLPRPVSPDCPSALALPVSVSVRLLLHELQKPAPSSVCLTDFQQPSRSTNPLFYQNKCSVKNSSSFDVIWWYLIGLKWLLDVDFWTKRNNYRQIPLRLTCFSTYRSRMTLISLSNRTLLLEST